MFMCFFFFFPLSRSMHYLADESNRRSQTLFYTNGYLVMSHVVLRIPQENCDIHTGQVFHREVYYLPKNTFAYPTCLRNMLFIT